MPRNVRPPFIQNAYYHVYDRGNRKNRIFNFPTDNKFFIQKLREIERMTSVEVVSYCLMDNHYHLVLKQGIGPQISKFMQRVKTSYSQYYNTRYRLVGHTFQGRYNTRLIKGISGLHNIIHYVIDNPVKAQYVSNPFYYKWLFVKDSYLHLIEDNDLTGVRPQTHGKIY
ncbi:transposase [Candidatus Dojkabacteria bacterium]|nr:transposase [Candidatus Dojkabacteria bacterium]